MLRYFKTHNTSISLTTDLKISLNCRILICFASSIVGQRLCVNRYVDSEITHKMMSTDLPIF